MPPIPIYSHSPIYAVKAAGTSPSTAGRAYDTTPDSTLPITAAAAQPEPPPAKCIQYPPAAPAAVPCIPVPTGSAQRHHSLIQPSPSQTTPASQGPPPPQPGAFPVLPGRGRATAPPSAGNAASGVAPSALNTQNSMSYPPQMLIPPPAAVTAAVTQRGTLAAAPSPLEHPPGYQQYIYDGKTDRHQRAKQDGLQEDEQRWGGGGLGGDEGAAREGVWGSAKRIAMAAGEKLADVESEVWKRINKE